MMWRAFVCLQIETELWSSGWTACSYWHILMSGVFAVAKKEACKPGENDLSLITSYAFSLNDKVCS